MVSAGLLAVIAWVLAGLIWSIAVPGYNAPAGTPTDAELASPSRPAPSPSAEEPRLSGFARAAAFAPFGSTQTSDSQLIENAPETRLRLKLLGVLTYGPDSGSAIIAAGGDDAELYYVGDTIGDELATLQQVHVDRVILERDGRLETLRLPRSDELRCACRGAMSCGSPAARLTWNKRHQAPPARRPRHASADPAGSRSRSAPWTRCAPSR